MSYLVNIDGTLPRALGLNKSELQAASTYFAKRSAARAHQVFQAVTIILQSDSASDEVHRAIMNVNGATDVITQRYDPMPGEKAGVYGELYVNYDQAIRVARKGKAWSPKKEFLLYVAHGMDHLTGADDYSPNDYQKMRRRELKWINEFLG